MLPSLRWGLIILAALTMVSATPQHARAGILSIAGADFQSANYTRADNGTSTLDLQEFLADTFPVLTTVSAADGATTASTVNHFFEEDAGALFRWTFDLERSTNPNAIASSIEADLSFMVTAPTTYRISGAFATQGPGPLVAFQSILYEQTVPGEFPTLFDNNQVVLNASDQSFVLGGTDGTFENTLSGSLTGTLVPGAKYIFYYAAYTQNLHFGAAASSTGSGFVQLEIGDVSAPADVPEPSSFALLGMGGLAMVGGWRRRRHRQPGRRDGLAQRRA